MSRIPGVVAHVSDAVVAASAAFAPLLLRLADGGDLPRVDVVEYLHSALRSVEANPRRAVHVDFAVVASAVIDGLCFAALRRGAGAIARAQIDAALTCGGVRVRLPSLHTACVLLHKSAAMEMCADVAEALAVARAALSLLLFQRALCFASDAVEVDDALDVVAAASVAASLIGQARHDNGSFGVLRDGSLAVEHLRIDGWWRYLTSVALLAIARLLWRQGDPLLALHHVGAVGRFLSPSAPYTPYPLARRLAANLYVRVSTRFSNATISPRLADRSDPWAAPLWFTPRHRTRDLSAAERFGAAAGVEKIIRIAADITNERHARFLLNCVGSLANDVIAHRADDFARDGARLLIGVADIRFVPTVSPHELQKAQMLAADAAAHFFFQIDEPEAALRWTSQHHHCREMSAMALKASMTGHEGAVLLQLGRKSGAEARFRGAIRIAMEGLGAVGMISGEGWGSWAPDSVGEGRRDLSSEDVEEVRR